MIKFIDKAIYPTTLVISIVISIFILFMKRHKKSKNRLLEKILASYMIFHEASTLLFFYLLFGKFPSMLLTDLSPFIFTLAIIPLLTNKANWMRKALMPYLILSGIITMINSKPGFSIPWQDDGKYMTIFIESFLTYVKHLIILTIGIYFIFTNDKSTKLDWPLTLFIPVTIVLWVLIASGIAYFTTDIPRWGLYSTGILEPATIPWGSNDEFLRGESHVKYLTEDQYKYVINNHNNWKDLFVKHGDKYYGKWLTTTTLWGDKYYEAEASYSMITGISRKMRIPYYGVVTIIYTTCTMAAFAVKWLVEIGKRKIKYKNNK